MISRIAELLRNNRGFVERQLQLDQRQRVIRRGLQLTNGVVGGVPRRAAA